MTQDIEKRVERLFCMGKPLLSRHGKLFQPGQVAFFTTEDGKTLAVTTDGERHETDLNLNVLEKRLQGAFCRVHRYFLVRLDLVEAIFERYPEAPDEPSQGKRQVGGSQDECELRLTGTGERVPVSALYAKGLKKALGVTSLHHLTPEHPDDKRLRMYGLIDFGWRELYGLDPKAAAAVEAFKKTWDVKKFSRERMLELFRTFGVNQIDKRRVIKNIIYQLYRWIKKDIQPLCDGNIRSLWYKVKAVLAYHSDVLDSNDVDVFYDTLQEMVEEKRLFRYKDFGFMDMNARYRGIGASRPEVILASEKIGQVAFTEKLALEAGTSFICMKGEPAVISLEYFSDDLQAACGLSEKTIFCMSDIDPAGYSIQDSLVEGLRRQGHQIGRVVKLIEPGIFTSEEIEISRIRTSVYEIKGGTIKPIEPKKMSGVTKARRWLERDLGGDPRFISEKDKGDGWKVVTIWGIESDAADRDLVRKRFLDGLSATPAR